MIIKAVEPLTGISCTRTYFLSDTWNEELSDASILAKIYSYVVDVALKAIEVLTNSSSPSLTEKLVKGHLDKKLKELPDKVFYGVWVFRLDRLSQDGSSTPLKDGDNRRCFKRASIFVYDVTTKEERGEERKLGSVAFAETFVDSGVETKDYKGAIGRRENVFVLTEGKGSGPLHNDKRIPNSLTLE